MTAAPSAAWAPLDTPGDPSVAHGLTSLSKVDTAEAPAAAARRRVTAWDVAGVLAFVSVMLGVNQVAVEAMGTDLGRSDAIRGTSAGVALVTVVLVALLALKDRTSPRRLAGRLVEVWADPPRPAVAFVLGAAIGIPTLGLFSPVLLNDSDSSRLLASILYVQRGGFDYFADTQEPALPHAILGPAMALGGLAAVKLMGVLAIQALAGAISWVTYRLTNSMWGAAGAALALFGLSPVFERVVRTPMYPAMLLLGYVGGYLAYRAVAEPDRAWRYAVPAGLCLVLAPEAQGVGQLFLAVPLVVVVMAPTLRSAFRSLVILYVVVGVASLPRIAVNISVGGLSAVGSPRADYWITEGYLVDIQRNFWNYQGVSETLTEFVELLPGRFVTGLGQGGWVVLVLAALGFLFAGRGRARWFILAATAFLLLAVIVKRIPPFPRYFSPFWPGMTILAGCFVAALARRRNNLARVATAGLVAVLLVAAGVAYRESVRRFADDRALLDRAPSASFVAAIDDGRGVIGARAHQLIFSRSAEILTWGDQFLTEDEYSTYLTWPSDRRVLDVLDRHDIGWVLIHKLRMLETQYNNTWLVPHRGLGARHIREIAGSDHFCRWVEEDDYVLFRVGECPPGRPLVGWDAEQAFQGIEEPRQRPFVTDRPLDRSAVAHVYPQD